MTLEPKLYTIGRNERVVIPANKTINGNGATIRWDVGDDPADDDNGLRALYIPYDGHDIEIYDLTIVADHALATGWTNGESKAIYIDQNSLNVSIHDCTFEDLPGFSIHAPDHTGSGISIYNNTFDNCGNGVNVNIDGASIHHNTFINSEGIEVAASDAEIYENTFNPALAGAISIGGLIGGSVRCSDNLVHDNHILGVEQGSNAGGIVVQDGCEDVLIYDNDIVCDGQGINFTMSSSNPISGTQISGNQISAGNYGIFILNYTYLTATLIQNNVVDGAKSGVYGLRLWDPDVTITGNDFRGSGSSADVYLGDTSVGSTYDGTNQHTTIVDDR